jgi:hypothetical protein
MKTVNRNSIISEKSKYNKNAISARDMRKIAMILKYINITNTSDMFDKNIVVGILNKLDNDNKDLISQDILKHIGDNKESVTDLFNVIFNNMLQQKKYADNYVYILRVLQTRFHEEINNSVQKNTKTFMDIIKKLDSYVIDINGYSIFLAKCVNFNLISPSILNNIIIDLISHSVEYRDNNLQNLIDALFNIIYNLEKKHILNNKSLLEKIKDIKNNQPINNKSKFQLMDIIDILSG